MENVTADRERTRCAVCDAEYRKGRLAEERRRHRGTRGLPWDSRAEMPLTHVAPNAMGYLARQRLTPLLLEKVVERSMSREGSARNVPQQDKPGRDPGTLDGRCPTRTGQHLRSCSYDDVYLREGAMPGFARSCKIGEAAGSPGFHVKTPKCSIWAGPMIVRNASTRKKPTKWNAPSPCRQTSRIFGFHDSRIQNLKGLNQAFPTSPLLTFGTR